MSINVNAKTEIKSVTALIATLNDYKSKNWAIGLTGNTLVPDSFLAFFTNRELPFAYYVRSQQGVSLGDPTAYQNNINTLNVYIARIKANEKALVTATIATLNDYKAKNWAIGLNGDTLQPDNLLPFFATRELVFAFYVRKPALTLGDAAAYDKNIATLNAYLSSL
ncbi:MAG: hypothetical protein L6Q74_07875 [Sphaerotilus natans subsp. sulfidivorans]|uniref:hypothetical protein n=1 Tax=Sphaerotilus sulfidivorans TaxID=639200 RepID=UPI002355D7A5|nr:hypothetical protein [Sphaerotilus sulfidivorans]MCK6401811.1 hypothetical protein [Sphaerotilus sulfidivorans]